MSKVVILPGSDITKLKDLLRQPVRSGPISSSGVAAPINQTRNYIVFTSEALPAATVEDDETTPGTAQLPVYQIDDSNKLVPVLDEGGQPVKEDVYNLSETAVSTEQFLVVAQERHTGRLVHVGGTGSNPGGSGTDSCGSCDTPIPVGSVIIDDKKYAFTYAYTSPADDIPAGEVDRNEDDDNWQGDSIEVECLADEPPEDPEE